MVLILEILFLVALAFTKSKKINYHYMLYHVMTPFYFKVTSRGEESDSYSWSISIDLHHQRQI